MRWSAFLFFAAISISAIAVYRVSNISTTNKKGTQGIGRSVTNKRSVTQLRLKQYAADLRLYTIKNNLNSRYCFLIDMQLPSGSKRFFVYDLKNDSILRSGLVTHGSGINNTTDTIAFSNKPGSNCSSLGKYKIGQSYYGKFGLAYKLYGLNQANSNAFSRFVVLHSHACVPDNEIAPLNICQSWGCPTISPIFLSQVKTYIDQSKTPVLLWIYK